MRRSDSDRALDHVLKLLPTPRAPHTLLPRVMAAVQAWTLRPWYERAWFTWPLAAQVAVVVTLIASAAGSLLLLSTAEASGLTAAPSFVGEWVGRLGGVVQSAEITVSAAKVIWAALFQPFMPYAFALVVLMCLACAAFGAALNRVTVGRTFQS